MISGVQAEGTTLRGPIKADTGQSTPKREPVWASVPQPAEKGRMRMDYLQERTQRIIAEAESDPKRRIARLASALAEMTEERDDWKRRAELARATAHSLVAKLEAVEHEVALLIPNDLWFGSIDDLRRFVIRQMQAALAITGPSVRQPTWFRCRSCNKTTDKPLWPQFSKICPHCGSHELEAALKGEETAETGG